MTNNKQRTNRRLTVLHSESLEDRRVLSAISLCSQEYGQYQSQAATVSELVKSARVDMYEQDIDAAWTDGDWDGSARFDSTDIVFAMQNGSVPKPIDRACAEKMPSVAEGNDAPTISAAAETRTARELAQGSSYSVIELSFDGPHQTAIDTPARDIEFQVTFRHEASLAEHTVLGYWDGDGQGGISGNQFKVRFTPTEVGRWDLMSVDSNAPSLDGQNEGDFVVALASTNKGFWIPDHDLPDHSWYQRSDGSHEYIVGNTHYTLLSGMDTNGQPTDTSIAVDIENNAQYFNKLRFSILSDLTPNPTAKPFLDDEGQPTDSGIYAHRPNPAWFHNRADVAVETALEHDLITDLIISGVVSPDSRRVLIDCKTNNPANCERPWEPETAYLDYIAARYGSFPNVWLTLVNEWDLRTPRYEPEEMVAAGTALKNSLAYPVPLSVHGKPGDWHPELTGDWFDHLILQRKTTRLHSSFNFMMENQRPGDPMPLINDEVSYQGAGDGHSELDSLEAIVGAFVGGGYSSTGYKPGQAEGQYVWGEFDAGEHTAADNLLWLRNHIDQHIEFWNMTPAAPADSIFDAPDWAKIGTLEAPGKQYILGTRGRAGTPVAQLPPGEWSIEEWDIVRKRRTILASNHTGDYEVTASQHGAALYVFTRADEAVDRIVDVNGDGRFDTEDLIKVFIAGKYELSRQNVNARATYDEGDWNGDGYFDSDDMNFAFKSGAYRG